LHVRDGHRLDDALSVRDSHRLGDLLCVRRHYLGDPLGARKK
jgi:hypothetical protein